MDLLRSLLTGDFCIIVVGLSINPIHYNTLHDILFKSNKYKITIYRDMFTLNTYRQDDFFELVTFFFFIFVFLRNGPGTQSVIMFPS